MPSPESIYARVRHYGANLQIKGETIAIIHQWKLPKEAISVIAANRDDLFRFLRAKHDEFEERAAIAEYDGGLPRAIAEEWARLNVYEIPRLSPEDRSYTLTAVDRILNEQFEPLLEERRAA